MSVLVVNFGSQLTQLIAKRLREAEVVAEVIQYNNINIENLIHFQAIIVSGSDRSLADLTTEESEVFEAILRANEVAGIPVMGICFGFQLICRSFSLGEVRKDFQSEFGHTRVDFFSICSAPPIVNSLPEHAVVWMSHKDSVTELNDGSGFVVAARSSNGNVAVITNDQRKIYGIQFHPEATHTQVGSAIFDNFITIAGCDKLWNFDCYHDSVMENIRNQVGDCDSGKVLAAVSGGVDSTVAAAMVHKVIGDRLHCVFLDHGLLRKQEVQEVVSIYNSLGIKLDVYDESEIFLGALKGVEDPEAKRKLIGKLFVECFEKHASAIEDVRFLMQGTLYPDVIESGVGGSSVIKSHHNVGGLPDRMKLKLIEPLKDLFKYEVRKIGLRMGLGEDFIYRHPFPGPGLAVRIPGAINEEKLRIIREVDDIYIRMLKERGLYRYIWQAFAVLLPVKAVGVMGDGRVHGYACVLRAVNSEDGMSADVFPIALIDHARREAFWDFLRDVSVAIVNSVKGVSRVLYDVTSKPPGTIEWE